VTYSAHHLEDPRLSRAVGDFLTRERASISAHVADEEGEETARAERQAAAKAASAQEDTPAETRAEGAPDET
jgi:hypothetical protein